jgi:hypothetical protein
MQDQLQMQASSADELVNDGFGEKLGAPPKVNQQRAKREEKLFLQ